MTETVITVRGTFQAWYQPERATVHVGVAFNGPERAIVLESATSTAAQLTATLDEILDKEAGPVTWWASDRMRVWGDRPWNDKGKQLPMVYHAALAVTAKFRDFGALAEWVESAAGVDGVGIEGITWDLTDGKRTGVTAEVRSRAVRDAVDKATVFAQSIGLKQVRAVAIADPGMLGDPGSASGATDGGYSRMAMASPARFDKSAPSLAFTPEDIEVTATVDARFVAS